MERTNVESTALRSIGFDQTNSILEIEFLSGVIWQYYDFPEYLWEEFRVADSKGTFFHREIKDNYNGSQVG